MDFVVEVRKKYAYMSANDVKAIVDRAKMFYFGYKYPCDIEANEEKYPLTNFISQQWILTACDELVERVGFSSATAYKENSVAWTFDNAQLSDRLVSLITPNVGTF